MAAYWMLIAILLPIAAGFAYLALGHGPQIVRRLYVMGIMILDSVLVATLCLYTPERSLSFMIFTRSLTMEFRLDGLGRLFAALLALLYPLTTLYAFSYLEHWRHNRPFFMFFLMSYGVTLGICFAGNLLTLYCFYELLTLATVPLVMNQMDHDSIRAARTYLIYSIGGASLAFVGVVFLIENGISSFELGGGLWAEEPIEYAVYVITFLGFSVKAALFPAHVWLPRASVAPTPVTALLHAVAVVKAGAFTVFRLTYYAYRAESLRGTWAQAVVLGLCAVTIVFGSVIAMRQIHFKRRLAYSTVANMSYILFGAALMTREGMSAGMQHLLFHAVTKILAFFCAGAVLHRTEREYIRDLDGMGYSMPLTFAAFAVSSLSLVGIPPLCGFVSKWNLLNAAAALGTPWAYFGAAALLISALCTSIYMFGVCARAWFPKGGKLSGEKNEADWRMTVPMAFLALTVILCGIFAKPICDWTFRIALGL